MNLRRDFRKSLQPLGNVDGVSLRNVTPAWASWLCFLIGVAYLAVLYL